MSIPVLSVAHLDTLPVGTLVVDRKGVTWRRGRQATTLWHAPLKASLRPGTLLRLRGTLYLEGA